MYVFSCYAKMQKLISAVYGLKHIEDKEADVYKRQEEMNFDDIVAKVKECGKKTVAVSVAQDSAVLEAVHEAKRDVYKRQIVMCIIGVAVGILLIVLLVKKVAKRRKKRSTPGRRMIQRDSYDPGSNF